MFKRLSITLAAFSVSALPLLAHPGQIGHASHSSLLSGFTHPIFGADHILAMIAVGLWASQISNNTHSKAALWAVPMAFVAFMALGFMAAITGINLPLVEPMILASVIAFGLLTAMATRLPVAAASGIVAVFAVFHGHAHGGELGNAAALEFGIGFIIATALLHFVGIAFGFGLNKLGGKVSRIVGGITAIAGLSLTIAG